MPLKSSVGVTGGLVFFLAFSNKKPKLNRPEDAGLINGRFDKSSPPPQFVGAACISRLKFPRLEFYRRFAKIVEDQCREKKRYICRWENLFDL